MSVSRPSRPRPARPLAAVATAAVATAAVVALAVVAPRAGAQLVTPKTIPVAQGDQFEIFPSSAVGMGGARIALADTLRDPFVNPAKATRLGDARLFGAPTFYTVSGNAGGGRTLPVGSSARFGAWTGAATVALQQLDKGEAPFAAGTRLTDRTAVNHYAAAALARPLGGSGWALGVGGEWAGLAAVDGVNLLYDGSDRIAQDGHMLDARVGLAREWGGGRTFELLLVHNRFAMTHDVTWSRWTWDQPAGRGVRQETRERNEDRTNIWGVHLEYERPLAAAGWRVGWLGTANVLSHPKIPNYVVMSIPRDPGTTYAYNLGVGVARAVGPATFAADVIYEPMWSETWADAAADTTGPNGVVVPRGARTVENRFRFSNAIVRLGVGREATLGASDALALGVRAGVALHAIDYRLDQRNNVLRTDRAQREAWMEWSPTWGLTFRFPEVELRYHGRYTTGVGRPGVANWGLEDGSLRAVAGGGIIAAPSGPLTLQDAHVVSHQVIFALPLR